VQSVPGDTTFRVWLPLAGPESDSTSPEPGSTGSEPGSSGSEPDREETA
jgi:hypothetical protein